MQTKYTTKWIFSWFSPRGRGGGNHFARSSCHSRWSETTEAISMQVTHVFGLLRYSRNDKK